MPAKQPPAATTPDKVKLTKISAARLSALTGVEADALAGRTVAELRDKFEWRIDPELLLFRRICGRVVKHDPVSGDDWGVPGATVHVYDTDFNLFGYFPIDWPYGWYWPYFWRREEIGHAVTDACGRFCVWIPRFEIDWILEWRRERICFPDIFIKPNLRDVLDRLREVVEVPPHIPHPGDPGPLDFLRGGIGSAAVLQQAVGPNAARKLAGDLHLNIGEAAGADTLLERRAFTSPVPPPAADHLLDRMKEHLEGKKHVAKADLARVSLARSWVGPFYRCIDVFVPEFLPIFDVPDITFGVTQDVNGDGVEEVIYSEGFFDVRWDAGYIPPVTLVADPAAFATPTCDSQPDLGPCAAPEIVLVGHMPLLNPTGAGVFPIIDTTTGYSVRANRPHSTGQVAQIAAAATPATAPASGLLEFWGCNHHLADGTPASHYRINARVSIDEGATFGPWFQIQDTWSNWRVVGNPPVLEYKGMSQLPGGWWEVLNPVDQWIPGDHYLLQWHSAPNGLIEMQLELGQLSGGTVTSIGTAPNVRLQVDNTYPSVQITALGWRLVGGPTIPLPLNCPTIHRNGQDIEVLVGVQATAAHLRSIEVSASGCGNGSPGLVTGFEGLEGLATPAANYWHKSASDNGLSRQIVWSVPASLLPGAYSFGLKAWSRAFEPGDGHVYTPTNSDTDYNPAPIWWPAVIGVAIVD
jgi:hypothetical protein